MATVAQRLRASVWSNPDQLLRYYREQLNLNYNHARTEAYVLESRGHIRIEKRLDGRLILHPAGTAPTMDQNKVVLQPPANDKAIQTLVSTEPHDHPTVRPVEGFLLRHRRIVTAVLLAVGGLLLLFALMLPHR
jgi:hypothetical protein